MCHHAKAQHLRVTASLGPILHLMEFIIPLFRKMETPQHDCPRGSIIRLKSQFTDGVCYKLYIHGDSDAQ